MAKFRVGDKVRLTSIDGKYRAINSVVPIGAVGRIVASDIVPFDYTVRFDDTAFATYPGKDGWGVFEKELELVEPATSTTPPQGFAVGDRVRVRKSYYEWNPKPEATGVVCRNGDSLCVKYDDNSGWDWVSSLEVIEVLSSATPKRTVAASTKSTHIPPYIVELAKLGDDRPAPNGDEFETAMLKMFSEDKRDWSTVPQTAKAYETAREDDAA